MRGERRKEKEKEREIEKARDVVVELFGPNRRQPLGKGSMQIRARLGARVARVDPGRLWRVPRRHRSKRLQARARQPWR